jgi:hypothetical protein
MCLEEKNQKADGKPSWKGKSHGPHWTQAPWRQEGGQPDPLPEQIQLTQTLPKELHTVNSSSPLHHHQIQLPLNHHAPNLHTTAAKASILKKF